MNYAKAGLRTMVFAQLRFTVADYKKFKVIRKLLRTTPNEELVELFDKLEQGLEFVGVAALNDELQENIKETLQRLRESGLRIWVLTGDQLQTSLYVAQNCGIFDRESPKQILIESSDSKGSVYD